MTAFQVTFDCADPHRLVRFWSEALGYEIEDNHDRVSELVEAGVVGGNDVVEVDGRLFFREAAACVDPARDRAAAGARLLFWLVPESKSAKNRVHFDLNVGREGIPAEVARLEALGATTLYEIDEPHAFHTTMADPEGNEFCVQ